MARTSASAPPRELSKESCLELSKVSGLSGYVIHVHSVRVWGGVVTLWGKGGVVTLWGGRRRPLAHVCIFVFLRTYARRHPHYTYTLYTHTCRHTPAQPLDEDQDREEEQYLEVRKKKSKKKSVSYKC